MTEERKLELQAKALGLNWEKTKEAAEKQIDDAGPVAYTTAGGTQVHRKTLGDVIGARARSRLFEMCRIVRMPAVEDYRVRRAR